MREVTPEMYGLPKRTVIEEIAENHIALVMNRKSRIIMKDGEKILAKVNLIRSVNQNLKVSLKTSAPVCSKTVSFLSAEGVEVLSV